MRTYQARNTILLLFLFASALSVTMLFQNCSDVNFATLPDKTHTIKDLGNGVMNEIFTSQKEPDPVVDILFVLDDSCSMSSIINNVKNGISSLQNVTFPASTLMAATYMSPVLLTNGIPDYTRPFFTSALGTPGHMQLVAKSSIDAFLSREPSKSSEFKSPGCINAWSSGQDKNSNGESCIVAALQAPFYCTIAEAGVTSFEQLLYKYHANGLKLFRDNSVANIIFVSDTHDPGASFYGRTDAPLRMKSYTELLNLTLANNPAVRSLRVSGIVPLPVEGDSQLTGVKVIGGAPKDAVEAAINGEGTHEYAYLHYIRASQGVAVHAKRNNWAEAISDLIQVTTATPAPKPFLLASRATAVLEVRLNGQLLQASEYALQDDNKTLLVFTTLDNLPSYEISIRYDTL